MRPKRVTGPEPRQRRTCLRVSAPKPLTPQETKDMLLKDKVAVITGGAGLNGHVIATARLRA